jgi:hypothetical protein
VKKIREKEKKKIYIKNYGKKVRGKKLREKKYGKKIERKGHVTSGQSLFRSLPVKHVQWSDPLDPPQIIICPCPYTTDE